MARFPIHSTPLRGPPIEMIGLLRFGLKKLHSGQKEAAPQRGWLSYLATVLRLGIWRLLSPSVMAVRPKRSTPYTPGPPYRRRPS